MFNFGYLISTEFLLKQSIEYLLGHGTAEEQDCVSVESPEQSNPLLAGAGFVHVLDRDWLPEPESHVNEHALQVLQSAQSPLT